VETIQSSEFGDPHFGSKGEYTALPSLGIYTPSGEWAPSALWWSLPRAYLVCQIQEGVIISPGVTRVYQRYKDLSEPAVTAG